MKTINANHILSKASTYERLALLPIKKQGAGQLIAFIALGPISHAIRSAIGPSNLEEAVSYLRKRIGEAEKEAGTGWQGWSEGYNFDNENRKKFREKYQEPLRNYLKSADNMLVAYKQAISSENNDAIAEQGLKDFEKESLYLKSQYSFLRSAMDEVKSSITKYVHETAENMGFTLGYYNTPRGVQEALDKLYNKLTMVQPEIENIKLAIEKKKQSKSSEPLASTEKSSSKSGSSAEEIASIAI